MRGHNMKLFKRVIKDVFTKKQIENMYWFALLGCIAGYAVSDVQYTYNALVSQWGATIARSHEIAENDRLKAFEVCMNTRFYEECHEILKKG